MIQIGKMLLRQNSEGAPRTGDARAGDFCQVLRRRRYFAQIANNKAKVYEVEGDV